MNPIFKLYQMIQEAKASEKAINDEWDAYMNEVELAGKKYLANLSLPGDLEYIALHDTNHGEVIL
jgi:hypothetical protein